ncbi:MAG: hypothetical protein V3S14_09715 [Anaerolineae bacterium]
MLSLVAEVYSAAGMTDGLTVDVVKSQAVIEDVGAVEQRVFHYGKKDTGILLRMTQRDPEYLHAVTSYEANVIKWNRDHVHAPIDMEHGAVPAITIEQVPYLAYPSDEIVGHILDVWHQVKT